MGNEALTAWGEQQISTLTENHRKKAVILHVKKLYWHTYTYGQVSVNEVLFRKGVKAIGFIKKSCSPNRDFMHVKSA